MFHQSNLATIVVVVATSLLCVSSTNAFVAPSTATITIPRSSATASTSTTKLYMADTSTGWDSFRDLGSSTDIPDGEEQRKFRRTVYSHDGTCNTWLGLLV